MRFFARLSVILALTFVCAGASLCEAKPYTIVNEGIRLELPDNFDVVTKSPNNPNVVLEAVDPSDNSRIMLIVARDKDADFRKGELVGKALEEQRDSIKKELMKKRATVLEDGIFQVSPDHEAVYVRCSRSLKDVPFEYVLVRMWAHKKVYGLNFYGRAEANRGAEFVQLAKSLVCLQK